MASSGGSSRTSGSGSNQKRDPERNSIKLHLTLPLVTYDKGVVHVDSNGKPVDDVPLELELDKVSTAEEDNDDEELFCQHLMRNKKRMSSELRDLYEVLQQLPTLADIRKKNVSVSKERTLRWVVSTAKNNAAAGTGSQEKVNSSAANNKSCRIPVPITDSSSSLSSSSSVPPQLQDNPVLSTPSDCCGVCAEAENGPGNGPGKRQVVKMHQINLYESILPPILFPDRQLKNK